MNDFNRKIARMVGVGFEGTTTPTEVDALLQRGVDSVIFFARNVESPQQFAELTADIKNRAGRPIMTCIDQEGGRVQRLREPFTIIPAMGIVGQVGDEMLAEKLARIMARELRAVNIDMDLAPVVDVNTNPANPVIGARSLGADVKLVSKLATAIIKGLQSEGVAACAKHFPGHGDTSQDSHHMLPTLPHALERLMSVEIPPFQAAIAAGVSSIMTAHVIFTPIDDKYPATMSEPVLTGLLRKRLYYDGVVFSDDMQMKAIADHYGFDDAIVRSVNAGVDCFWVCHSHELQNRAIDVLIKAVENGKVPRERVEQSNARLDRLFAAYAKPPVNSALEEIIGAGEHRAVAEEIVRLSQIPAAVGPQHDPTEGWR